MSPRFARLCFVTLAFCGGVAFAQEQRPQPEGKPRLVLNTGGHSNQVRALAFSEDSQRLYSAGLDKVVLGWEMQVTGRRVRSINANLVQTLRWEINRGMRGVIFELASGAFGGERLLAIGGESTRGQGGDIVIYDAAQGEVKRTLDQLQQTLATGGLAISPDGAHLAATSILGDLWLWSLPDFTPRQLAVAEGKDRPYRALTFLDSQTLAVAVPSGKPGDDQWDVAFYDLGGGEAKPRLLRSVHRGALTTIVRDPNSERWATADKSGNVFIWTGTAPQEPLRLPRMRTAEGLDVAFGPGKTLFVATRLLLQDGLVGADAAFLEYWNFETQALLDEIQTSLSLDNYAVTVSPDLRWVATCGDEHSPVFVFPLQDAKGEFLAQPLRGRGAQKVKTHGVGTSLGKVAFAADGTYRIGFGGHDQSIFNDYSSSISHVFDLSRGLLLRTGQFPPAFRSPDDGKGDWSLKIDPDRYGVQLNHAKGYACSIQLDPSKQGQITSYCFLQDGRRPIAVILGTNHQNGIFVYQLVAEGECPLLRYYRDHAYVVTSLGVSADGKYLASTSFDQTIKIWSLDGLTHWQETSADNSAFAKASSWGAVFARGQADVKVAKVRTAGIAHGRNMREGDLIAEVKKVEAGAVRTFRSRDDIWNVLEDSTPFEQLTIAIRRGGERIDLPQIVPAWEPAASLFVDDRGEWAFFTPQGPYAASAAGGELFGWQFNMGRATTPKFFVAEQLRQKFELPNELRKLFVPGNVASALSMNYDGLLGRLGMEVPEIQIIEPADGRKYAANEEITVRAKIRYPLGASPANFQVAAYNNATPLRAPRRQGSALDEVVVWKTRVGEVYNTLLVEVSDPKAPPDAPYSRKTVSFKVDAPEVRPRLHFLAMAADAYPGAFRAKYTRTDGESLMSDLKQFALPLYDEGKFYDALENEELSRESVARQISQIQADLADAPATDLLIVYVGGHGVAIGDEYYFVPPDKKFAGLNKDVAQFGIPWSELRRLGEVPCRKLVFLNTCFSGNVFGADSKMSQASRSFLSLREAHMLIVSATRHGEQAIEPPGEQRGAFMDVVHAGLSGLADGFQSDPAEGQNEQDGVVDLRELVAYVADMLPQKTQSYSEFGPQSPSHSPFELFRGLNIPLAQNAAVAARGNVRAGLAGAD